MEKLTLEVAFELKNLHDDEDDPEFFIFEGLASTFGNTDLVNDVIEQGAFVDTIARKMPVLLFQHNQHEPIGMPEVIRETMEGLFVRGRLPKADTLVSGRVIPQMKVGSLKSMSIGFSMGEDDFEIRDGKRFIKRVNLHEISLVTFPANELAKVSGFKAVGAAQDLPLAPLDREWDSDAAIARVRTFTNSTEEPSARYKRAFFFSDADNAENFDDYKLLFVDIIDSKMMAVPQGIQAANVSMQNMKASVDVTGREQVQNAINGYLAKIERARATEKHSFVSVEHVKEADTPRKLERLLRDSDGISKDAALMIASKCKESQGEPVDSLSDSDAESITKKLDELLLQTKSTK